MEKKSGRVTKRADITSKNEFLLVAAEYGHRQIVQVLLESSRIDLNQRNQYEQNALHRASKAGHREIVAMLIAESAAA